MRRKKLTNRQKADLYEAHNRTCWRCKLPIDPHRDVWHVGHIIDLGCGGSDTIDNMAPEHARCNKHYADTVGNTLAAKVERVRQRNLGVRKEPSRLARQWAWFKEERAKRMLDWKKRILAERST